MSHFSKMVSPLGSIVSHFVPHLGKVVSHLGRIVSHLVSARVPPCPVGADTLEFCGTVT
jgi:hypothetical protein